MAAATELGGDIRVVSLTCWERFDRQPEEYRESVLPSTCSRRVAIEAGITGMWRRYVGLEGKVVGIDRFGLSAPGGQVMEELGITPNPSPTHCYPFVVASSAAPGVCRGNPRSVWHLNRATVVAIDLLLCACYGLFLPPVESDHTAKLLTSAKRCPRVRRVILNGRTVFTINLYIKELQNNKNW